jgi:hypothetical protein
VPSSLSSSDSLKCSGPSLASEMVARRKNRPAAGFCRNQPSLASADWMREVTREAAFT